MRKRREGLRKEIQVPQSHYVKFLLCGESINFFLIKSSVKIFLLNECAIESVYGRGVGAKSWVWPQGGDRM